MVDLSIVIINYNTKDLTIDCLKSVFSQSFKGDLEVIVVDNGSSSDELDQIKKQFPGIKAVGSETNLGFSRGNNLGIKNAPQSRYYLLLNSDTRLVEGALNNLIAFADSHDFGIISPRLLNPDKSFQPNAGELPTMLYTLLWLSNIDGLLGASGSYHASSAKYYQNGKKVGWVSGAAMLIKKEVIDQIGMLDEKIFMYGEDVEYCFRASEKGVNVGWTNAAEVIHIGGASSKDPRYKQWLGEFKGLLYLYQKYYGALLTVLVRLLIYTFVLLRVIAFALTGKFDYAITYGKIIFTL